MPPNSGRIESLDALRGFALMGILVVNIQMFSGWGFLGTEGRESLSWSEYDSDLLFWLKVFAHDKFYSLFSLMFGYSFVMVAGHRGAGYHLRRMVGLAVIGLAHALLLWPWDILLLYALVGFFLTPFLRAGALTLLLSSLLVLLAVGIGRALFEPGWHAQWLEVLADAVPVMANGAYSELPTTHWTMLQFNALDRMEDLRPLRVMAMFLIGAAAARLGLARPQQRSARRLFIIGLISLPSALFLAYSEQHLAGQGGTSGAFYLFCETLAGPLMASAYGAWLLLWWNQRNLLARGVRAIFAPTGRMALTNYLGQSALCVPLFYGFGGGLFAEYSLAKLTLFALGLFAGQLLFSALWLTVFRQGPLEWLWRWQIQGSRPAMLK